MIEATCAACGTLNRIAETEVPMGAKFVTCASCKSRVPIAGKPISAALKATIASAAPPVMPKLPATPKLPSAPPPKVPAIPVPVPAGAKPVIDLADLPTPKRSSALAGAGDAKPAPKSALAAAGPSTKAPSPLSDLADLPTPKVAARGPAPSPAASPAAPPRSSSIADLPAPKGAVPSINKAKDALADLADLPTPKVTPPARPAAAKTPPDIVDLPTPKGISDLPTPKVAKPPAVKPTMPTMPAPTPTRPTSAATLPGGDAPRPAAPRQPPADIVDVVAPKGSDLPPPKAAARTSGVTRPPGDVAGSSDLPAPKGFFDDLPQPALTHKPGSSDLPAPKGFFDDLPQPALTHKPGSSDLPAPKGFFDDLPQPALTHKPGVSDLPAPKGFFDDLPQPALSSPSVGPAVDPAAAKGFFDDLPLAAMTKPGGFSDASQAPHPPPTPFAPPAPLAPLAPPPAAPLASPMTLDDPLAMSELDLAPGGSNNEIELHGPSPELDLASGPLPAGADGFGDLDLSTPSAKSHFKIDASAKAAAAAMAAAAPPMEGGASFGLASSPSPGEAGLELEDVREAPSAKQVARQQAAKREAAAPAPVKKRRTKLYLGIAVGVALAGSGGFYMYQRHVAAQERAATIAAQLKVARGALTANDANHWARSLAAAKAVLVEDESHGEALGIGAQAALAGALENGIAGPTRIALGRKMIADALAAGVTGRDLDTAQALNAIGANQPDRAITKLTGLITHDPKDPYLQLYMGWALLAKGDGAGAIKALDQAAAMKPELKTTAIYSRGKAHLLLADLNAARADFTAVLEVQKDHIAAQVGLAASSPPSQTAQREGELLAILARKDIPSADPRAVTLAWTLAGDAARATGRLDVARERYRKAIAINALDVSALAGLAATELRDDKVAPAADLIQKALTQSPDDIEAQLVAADLEIRQGKLNDAETRLKALSGRSPPVAPLQRAHLQLALGKMLEARGDDDAAIDAWVEGSKAVGELDLAPTMAAVTKLGALSAKNPAKAGAYRERADQLLSSLAERAIDDAQLSMTLGIAYLEANDPAKAEGLLRRTVDMRASDIEARLALSKALVKLNRIDDAIGQLSGALTIDPSRIDVSLELARTYETAGRDADAAQAYDKLLAATEIPIPARERAGRFYARIGNLDKAIAQADPILSAERDNAAGHYFRGEGLLVKGDVDNARKEFQIAIDNDPDAYYYDAAGRAAEASLAQTGDSKYQNQAIHNYERSHELLATLFNPLSGMGRIYVSRKEWEKANQVLQAANGLRQSDPEVMFELGVCAQELGQKDVAIQWLKAANQVKSTAETSYRLGVLFHDTDQAAAAAGAYDSATRLAEAEIKKTGKPIPWLLDAYYELGDIELLRHEDGKAREAWEHFLAHDPPAGEQRTRNVREQLKTWMKNH
jgi:tetratricopeptide (TPR) repeat protein